MSKPNQTPEATVASTPLETISAKKEELKTPEKAEKPVHHSNDAETKVDQTAKEEKTAPESEIEIVQPAEIKNGQLILTNDQKNLIQKMVAPTATPDELKMFFMMAYRTRLDPLMKQLYFIKYGQGDKAKVSYVTSIDGYRIIAHRTGMFDGIDEPLFERDKNGAVVSCTIKLYRKDASHGFSATVKFREYTTGMNLWQSKPETMIAKVAEAHALRKAFPNDLSGIYTTDEMDQATTPAQNGPRMASEQQRKMIMSLVKKKGSTTEKLKEFFKKSFNIDSSKQLTSDMASKVITAMLALPDPKPVELEIGPDPTEEDLAQSSNQVDLDEIDAGIEKSKQSE